MSANTGNPVVDAILNSTSNQEVREAMLLGSDLESSWNQSAVGDNGTSFGPFQMHIGGALTAAGGTPQDAENPSWAVNNWALQAYTNAVNSIPQSLWSSNPEQAAEQAAVAAESPAQSYFASQGTGTVDAKWSQTQAALKGQVSTSGAPGGASTTGLTIPGIIGQLFDPLGNLAGGLSGSDLSSAGILGSGIFEGQYTLFQWLLQQFGINNVKDFFIRAGLLLMGAVLIIIGISAIVKQPVSEVMSGGTESGDDESGPASPEASSPAPETSSPAKPGKTSPQSKGKKPKTLGLKTGAGKAAGEFGKSAEELGAVAVA